MCETPSSQHAHTVLEVTWKSLNTRFRFSASSFCPMDAHTSVYTTSAPLTASQASLEMDVRPTPAELASSEGEDKGRGFIGALHALLFPGRVLARVQHQVCMIAGVDQQQQTVDYKLAVAGGIAWSAKAQVVLTCKT